MAKRPYVMERTFQKQFHHANGISIFIMNMFRNDNVKKNGWDFLKATFAKLLPGKFLENSQNFKTT